MADQNNNNKPINIYELKYTHKELEYLLEELVSGTMLSDEQYNYLVNVIGLENLSTFSGNFDDLINKPDIIKEVTRAGFEKEESVNRKLNALIADTNDLINESYAVLDSAKADSDHDHKGVYSEIDHDHDTKYSFRNHTHDSLEVLDQFVTKDELENRLDGGVGMTEEERAQLAQKFDYVTTEKVMGEDNTPMTQLTFYSGGENGKVVKRIQFAGGIGGGGALNGGTLSTTYPSYNVIEEKDSVIIPYSFQSPNYGAGTLFVTVVNGDSSKDIEYPVKKQGAGSINLGTLNKGINVISMYVVDAFSQITNIIDLTIVCGAIEINSTFDDGLDYTIYANITIPFNLSAIDPKDTMTLEVKIDEKTYTKQVYDGYNDFSYPAEMKTIGVHKVSLQVKGTGFESNVLKYNIIMIDKASILLSTEDENLELEHGINVSFDYRLSTAYVSNYFVEYFLDDSNEAYGTGQISIGKNTFTGSYKDFGIGSHKITILAYTEDRAYTDTLDVIVDIKPSSFKRIEHATAGLQAYFDMSSKSNNDLDKDSLLSVVPTEDGNFAKLVLHDYNFATNGWIDGRLVSNGKAWGQIENYLPLVNNVEEGFTFDILFTSNNAGVNSARVIDCTGDDVPYRGFYIDSEKAVLTTDANQLTSYYTDRTDMRVTFVVNRTSTYYEEYILDENGHSVLNPNPTYKPNPMVQTFIDGIFTDVAMLSDQGSGANKVFESIAHSNPILINTDKAKQEFGNSAIKSIRIYNRPLSYEEVLQNYIADYDSLEDQKAIYDKNYVTVDQDIPTLHFYDTEIGKCDLMTKDTKQWINIVYTSPNKEIYGESFDLMGQCSWQGTSSLAYPVKNYKFKLYDWARNEEGDIIEELRNDKDSYTKKKIDLYPSAGNGHKENTFCIKVDYMDSSHCRNTGTARLVNDFLFDGHPNPAKQIDPKTRDSINGHPVQIIVNGKWIGMGNFNHDKSCTKTLGLETIPHTVRWEIKANSDTSAGAFVKTWTDVESCYKAINADFEIVFDEDAFEEKTGEYDVTKYYDELGFAHNGTVMGTYYDYAILSLARFVNFVSEADEETYKRDCDKYFDKVQACRYYLNVMTLGMIDNFAKNCIINMYGDDIWWFSFYDMDSSLGLDNTGYNKFDSAIEPAHPGIYNCSTSRMWVKLNEWAQDDLYEQFITIRENKYTYENICDYLINQQIDVIPQLLYNKDMYTKYISQGRQYLHMLHGNNKDHLKRWLYNRFQYVDSLFLQHNSPYTKQNITVRSCKPTWVPENERYTARFEIQTYCPQYVTVCWRKNTFETKRVGWNETVVFENEMVNSQDNELIVYCATNLKSLGVLSCVNPTAIDLGAANRLIELTCENSDKLVKADISKNSYLKTVSFNNCQVLGTASGGSNVLDISTCTNLKDLDIRGTKITSVKTNTQGGNIEKILYPIGIQDIVLANQTNLEVVGLPFEDNKALCESIATFDITNCNAIKCLQYPYDENTVVNFEPLKNVQYLKLNNTMPQIESINIKGFDKLKQLAVSNMPELKAIDFLDMMKYNATSVFEKLELANIPNVNKISFNVTSDLYKIAFTNGAIIDLGALNLETIEANTGVRGATKLILPVGLKELKFTNDYGSELSDLVNIWSFRADHTNDGFEGMDLKDMLLTHIDMTGLPQITRAINFNIAPVNQNPNLNAIRDGSVSKPFFKPEGSIDLTNYNGGMVNLFKGIDLNKLNITISGTKTPYNLTSLFEAAIIPDRQIPTINKILTSCYKADTYNNMFKDAVFENAVPSDISIPLDRSMYLSGMFKNTNVKEDIEMSEIWADVSEMFMDCKEITSLHSNWDKVYQNASFKPNDCYARCYGARLHDVPAIWGGYGFNENDTAIYVLDIPEGQHTVQITSSLELAINKGYIDWGDGSVSQLAADGLKHTYASAGKYEVLAQCLPGKYGDEYKMLCTEELIEVKRLPKGHDNFNGCFVNANRLRKVTAPDLKFRSIGLKNMFWNCSSLEEIIGTETWDVSNVNDLGSVFGGCSSLKSININGWVTDNVASFFNMFYNCSSLTELDVKSLNTANATNMQYMFSGCSSLTSLDVSNMNIAKANYLVGLFNGCTNLIEIIGLENWVNNKVVKNISSIFNNCTSLKAINLSGIDLGGITYNDATEEETGKMDYLFKGCTSLTNLTAPKNLMRDVSLEDCINLNVNSINNVISNLGDFSGTSFIRLLTLGPVNLAKLQPAEIAVATNKGWTVV
jgi:surface protein